MYVQLKKLVIHAQHCRINVYRVINLTKYQDYYTSNGNVENEANAMGESKDQLLDQNMASEDGFGQMSNPGGSGSMSSMSSTVSQNTAFNRSVKDFKK